MIKEPKYMWDEEHGTAICIIYYKDKSFCGTADCHPTDKDFQSERTGEHIAYMRAYLDYLKYVRDNEEKPRLLALTHLYGTMKHSSYFNQDSYEANRIRKEIKNAQIDLDTVRDLIDMYKKDLKQYIDEKDNFYQKMRSRSAKKGQKD